MGHFMGAFGSTRAMSTVAADFLDTTLNQHGCVVFSKSWCPYCQRVVKLLNQVGANFELIELDKRDDGDAIHAQVKQRVGGTSVPRVFINKKHIGGCDDTVALHNSGKLKPMLKDANALNE